MLIVTYVINYLSQDSGEETWESAGMCTEIT